MTKNNVYIHHLQYILNLFKRPIYKTNLPFLLNIWMVHPDSRMVITTRKKVISDQSISDQNFLIADNNINDQILVADIIWINFM